jgi:hypothetical protein
MKRHLFLFILIISCVGILVLGGQYTLARGEFQTSTAAGAPTVVSYQGKVTVNGIPYTGTGYFKFAVVNSAGDTTYWSNDGTSVGAGEPTDEVTLVVNNGLFNVLLGDNTIDNMNPLSATVFNGTGRYLRVWFSDDNATFTKLNPDRRIAAVPYALQAEEARNAGTLGGMSSSEFWQLGGNTGTTFGTDYLGTSDAVNLAMGVNGQTMITLDTAGRFGLGTTNPEEKLTLNDGDFLQKPGDPVHAGTITDDPTIELSGANGIHVSGKYAYVASLYDSGVEILDISDPTNPTHVGAITDDETTELNGAVSIYVSGKYAYIAAYYDNGMEILDISDPTNPTHVGAITDDGTTALDGATDIYVSGKYAYVVSWLDDGLEILDISDPTNPIHVGSITDDGITELDGAQGIYVSGNYAYVAAPVDDGVEILDISDPTNPTHVGAITDDGVTALDGARAIYVSGKYAYVASQFDAGVEILDISDPTNPTHVGSIIDDETTELNGAHSIYVYGKYAYVASFYDNGVEILDVSDPANPTHVGAITDDGTIALLGAIDIYVSGKYAYVVSQYDGGMEILDIAGIDTPTANIGTIMASTLSVNENAQVGNDLYVGNGIIAGTGGIQSGGDVGVEGNLRVNGDYVQLPTINGVNPPSADCDEASEYGRMVVRVDTSILYICVVSGWVGK